MMVRIDRKFNEKQLLLEIFFSKMHIEWDIRKKVISGGLKPTFKKAPGGGSGGFNMLFRTSFSEHFPHFAGSFRNFFSSFAWNLDYKEGFPFLICRRKMKQFSDGRNIDTFFWYRYLLIDNLVYWFTWKIVSFPVKNLKFSCKNW